MFDMFSKLGELKSKAEVLKKNIHEKTFEIIDETGMVKITINGKKDILSIVWEESLEKFNKEDKQLIILNAIKNSQTESENYLISELKNIIPNIPGLNLF